MNVLRKILLGMLMALACQADGLTQEWPAGGVNGGCMGSELCGCADCRAQLRAAPQFGGPVGMPQPGWAGAAMAGMRSQLHPFQAIEGGYHPQARAYPAMFGNQIANPYDPYGGCGPGGCGDGGCGPVNYGSTCCGPSWYDVSIQGVFLRRTGDVGVDISRWDPTFVAPVAGDPVMQRIAPPMVGAPVLSTDSGSFDYEGSYRVALRYQLNAVSSLEAIYLGELESDSFASFTVPNNGLFHVFSQFGVNPLGGYEETDQATTHDLAVETQLESVEVSMRRGWITPRGRASGSWIFGARYIRLEDNLRHTTNVQTHLDPFNVVAGDPMAMPPTMDQYAVRPDAGLLYLIDTTNDLVGVQMGSEVSYCVIPGLLLAGHAKLGLYGNNASQNSNITSFLPAGATSLTPESASTTRFAYGSDANVFFLWQFHPLAKVRAGYEVLFLSDVATGATNFDVGTPFPPNPVRSMRLSHDDILYHGFHFGFELGW